MRQVIPHAHSQDVESDLWVIDHGLYCNPVVSVKVLVNGQLTEILPKNISFPSLTQVTIEFTKPFAGEARLA